MDEKIELLEEKLEDVETLIKESKYDECYKLLCEIDIDLDKFSIETAMQFRSIINILQFGCYRRSQLDPIIEEIIASNKYDKFSYIKLSALYKLYLYKFLEKYSKKVLFIDEKCFIVKDVKNEYLIPIDGIEYEMNIIEHSNYIYLEFLPPIPPKSIVKLFE